MHAAGHQASRRHRRSAADKGFTGSRLASEVLAAQIEVIIPPARPGTAQHHTRDPAAADREPPQPVKTSCNKITGQMELARHGAHTFEGLPARTVATLAVHTLLLTQFAAAR
jgi:hypothetical protein